MPGRASTSPPPTTTSDTPPYTRSTPSRAPRSNPPNRRVKEAEQLDASSSTFGPSSCKAVAPPRRSSARSSKSRPPSSAKVMTPSPRTSSCAIRRAAPAPGPRCANSPGTDRLGRRRSAGTTGHWTYTVEAWSDPVSTWRHHAGIKIPAGIDTELVLEEGAPAVRARCRRSAEQGRDVVLAAATTRWDTGHSSAARLAAPVPLKWTGSSLVIRCVSWSAARSRCPCCGARAGAVRLLVRVLSAFEESGHLDPPVHGTSRSAAERLPAIARMDSMSCICRRFIPSGPLIARGPTTLSLRGRTTSVCRGRSAPGGHDAVHPDLGTIDDSTPS